MFNANFNSISAISWRWTGTKCNQVNLHKQLAPTELPTIKKMYLISHNNDIIRLDDCHNLQQTTIEWKYVSFLLINHCVICLVEVRQKFELHFYVCFSNEIDIPVNWHPVGQVSL